MKEQENHPEPVQQASAPAQEAAPSRPPSPERNNGGVGGLDESGNVDRIRHILFGNQMRDYDSRFQRLEERLAKEASELRGDLQKRLDQMESFIRSEVESITGRQRLEASERASAFDRARQDLSDTARSLEARIASLDQQTANDLRDLRQRLLDQAKALSAEIKERHDQVEASLADESAQIRHAMTGRESLSEMLSEMALRLKGEFHVPGTH